MTADQRNGIVRELVFAILAALVSFDLCPGTAVDLVAAAVIAVALLIWGLIEKPTDGASLGSLIRKAVQAIPPVLVHFSVLAPEQGVTVTGVVLAIVGTWSFRANSENSKIKASQG
jgi:hypothetical protein